MFELIINEYKWYLFTLCFSINIGVSSILYIFSSICGFCLLLLNSISDIVQSCTLVIIRHFLILFLHGRHLEHWLFRHGHWHWLCIKQTSFLLYLGLNSRIIISLEICKRCPLNFYFLKQWILFIIVTNRIIVFIFIVLSKKFVPVSTMGNKAPANYAARNGNQSADEINEDS